MTAPYTAPDRRPKPNLARQADGAALAAEHWQPIYSQLARTAEAKAWANFDLDLTLRTGAATLRRLADLAEATSDAAIDELLLRAEARAREAGAARDERGGRS